MTKETVQEATKRAREFIKLAKDWEARLALGSYFSASKEGGALRRASMELSRALSKMRKP